MSGRTVSHYLLGHLYVAPRMMAEGPSSTVAIPLGGGFPPVLVPNGVDSAGDARLVPGVKFLNHASVAPGADPDHYAFLKNTAHRNLYRIPLQ
jgi:hypothetical protein